MEQSDFIDISPKQNSSSNNRMIYFSDHKTKPNKQKFSYKSLNDIQNNTLNNNMNTQNKTASNLKSPNNQFNSNNKIIKTPVQNNIKQKQYLINNNSTDKFDINNFNFVSSIKPAIKNVPVVEKRKKNSMYDLNLKNFENTNQLLQQQQSSSSSHSSLQNFKKVQFSNETYSNQQKQSQNKDYQIFRNNCDHFNQSQSHDPVQIRPKKLSSNQISPLEQNHHNNNIQIKNFESEIEQYKDLNDSQAQQMRMLNSGSFDIIPNEIEASQNQKKNDNNNNQNVQNQALNQHSRNPLVSFFHFLESFHFEENVNCGCTSIGGQLSPLIEKGGKKFKQRDSNFNMKTPINNNNLQKKKNTISDKMAKNIESEEKNLTNNNNKQNGFSDQIDWGLIQLRDNKQSIYGTPVQTNKNGNNSNNNSKQQYTDERFLSHSKNNYSDNENNNNIDIQEQEQEFSLVIEEDDDEGTSKYKNNNSGLIKDFKLDEDKDDNNNNYQEENSNNNTYSSEDEEIQHQTEKKQNIRQQFLQKLKGSRSGSLTYITSSSKQIQQDQSTQNNMSQINLETQNSILNKHQLLYPSVQYEDFDPNFNRVMEELLVTLNEDIKKCSWSNVVSDFNKLDENQKQILLEFKQQQQKENENNNTNNANLKKNHLEALFSQQNQKQNNHQNEDLHYGIKKRPFSSLSQKSCEGYKSKLAYFYDLNVYKKKQQKHIMDKNVQFTMIKVDLLINNTNLKEVLDSIYHDKRYIKIKDLNQNTDIIYWYVDNSEHTMVDDRDFVQIRQIRENYPKQGQTSIFYISSEDYNSYLVEEDTPEKENLMSKSLHNLDGHRKCHKHNKSGNVKTDYNIQLHLINDQKSRNNIKKPSIDRNISKNGDTNINFSNKKTIFQQDIGESESGSDCCSSEDSDEMIKVNRVVKRQHCVRGLSLQVQVLEQIYTENNNVQQQQQQDTNNNNSNFMNFSGKNNNNKNLLNNHHNTVKIKFVSCFNMKGFFVSQFVNYTAKQGVIVWVDHLIDQVNKKRVFKSF